MRALYQMLNACQCAAIEMDSPADDAQRMATTSGPSIQIDSSCATLVADPDEYLCSVTSVVRSEYMHMDDRLRTPITVCEAVSDCLYGRS